jgi:hypothetical protein
MPDHFLVDGEAAAARFLAGIVREPALAEPARFRRWRRSTTAARLRHHGFAPEVADEEAERIHGSDGAAA